MTQWRKHSQLDSLAAAYAEVGEFKEAQRYQEMAMEDPVVASDWFLRDMYTRVLEGYKSNKPLRAKP